MNDYDEMPWRTEADKIKSENVLVLNRASRQAEMLGSSYLRMSANGALEILEPGSILLKPNENRGAVDAMSTAIKDVLAERIRQVNAEGWTDAHDDQHTECELARAAAVYATCTDYAQLTVLGATVWPWNPRWWKPTTYRRNLVKAAALIIAEIERIDRRDAKKQELAQLQANTAGMSEQEFHTQFPDENQENYGSDGDGGW